MSETIVKPEVGKPFTFEMALDLDDLIVMGNIDALNDMMNNEFLDRFAGDGLILYYISYKPIRIDNDGLIVIEVSAQDVEKTDPGGINES